MPEPIDDDGSSANDSSTDDASSPAASDGSLADALAALEAQARSLASRKTLLSSRLLSLQRSFPLAAASDASAASTPSAPPPTDDSSFGSTVPDVSPGTQSTIADVDRLTDSQILSFAISRSRALNRHSVTRLHRIAGITTFTVRDPSPAVPEQARKLLGIRIEVFSREQFSRPHYVLLSLQESRKHAGEQYFAVARHSIPAFLGLGQLANEFLPPSTMASQRLDAFVSSLRTRILQHRRRVVAAEDAKATAMRAGRIGDVMENWMARVEDVSWDLPVEVVTVSWMNGAEGLLRVDARGRVTKVVVQDARGRRKAAVETKMKGHLDGLAERMDWVRR